MTVMDSLIDEVIVKDHEGTSTCLVPSGTSSPGAAYGGQSDSLHISFDFLSHLFLFAFPSHVSN